MKKKLRLRKWVIYGKWGKWEDFKPDKKLMDKLHKDKEIILNSSKAPGKD